MNKHTPGPWRKGTPGPNGCYTIGTMRGLMTAMIAHSLNEPDQAEQAEADANLIAEAPNLLETLVKFREAFVIAVGDKSPFAKIALTDVDNAIARARGES